MSEFTPHHDSVNHHASTFGDTHSFGEHQPHAYNLFPDSSHGISGNETILHHVDPLSVAHKYSMYPLKIHLVKPHLVSGTAKNGSFTKPYIRDGHGGGYLRSNPDGIVENNLDHLFGN
jgi:hypothetical protein